jgi:hypothetical protein
MTLRFTTTSEQCGFIRIQASQASRRESELALASNQFKWKSTAEFRQAESEFKTLENT